MAQTKHTPGPWRAKEVVRFALPAFDIESVEGHPIGVVVNQFPVDKANAQLIAAAPELLAHLQKLCAAVQTMQGGFVKPSLDIMKVTGECVEYLIEKGFL